MQDLRDAAVVEHAPEDIALAYTATDAPREAKAFTNEATQYRSRRPDLPERVKDHPQSLLDVLIRIECDGTDGVVDQTDRQCHFQFAAPRLVALTTEQAGLEHVQFGFAHGPLEPEEQSIVEVGRIVNPILIEDQSLGECRQLEQPMPVGVVAREARHFKPKHDPGVPECHFAHELLDTIDSDLEISGAHAQNYIRYR